MEFAEILKAYLEVGVLGLCAVTLVTITIWVIRNIFKTYKNKDEQMGSNYSTLLNTITSQNNQLMDRICEQSAEMVTKVVEQITTHVPTAEDNTRQTKISEQIDKCLQDMLLQTNASRASLVQYHNGGRGVNKQSFLKMSMTNEQVQLGVKQQISGFKDQFRSVLGYFVRCINEVGSCYIQDVESIKNKDCSLYEFMTSRGIHSKFGVAVKGPDDYVLGFICLEYLDEREIDIDKIKTVLLDYQHTIQALLNM